jgi:undecaprenyl-diphosphatase
MMSAVVYLTLAALVTRLIQRKRLKGYALGVAMILTLMVGVSRVYLGVHWPSDVLAGWCAGFAWAMLCWIVARRLRPRSEGPDPA